MGWVDEQPINTYGTLARQCTEKSYFSTRKLARRVARKLARQYGYPIEVYRCVICTRWHLSRRKVR